MEVVGIHEWGSQQPDDEFQFHYTYRLLVCPTCHRPTLHEIYSDEESCLPPDYESQETILFPSHSVGSPAVPKKIAKAYQAAVRAHGIDHSLCAMGLRRTLELILCDLGATEWGLKDKIEEISADERLPEFLKEASYLTKRFGDDAAHGKEADYDFFDVEYMVGFVGHIIDYLYVLPYKLNGFKEHTELKKKWAKDPEPIF
ncbi:MAG: DUF4145 domain-containing protein [Coriobacteriales bacterium]|nr:DUF4145 domain-containing protein [Coriobacteriales bacterium]